MNLQPSRPSSPVGFLPERPVSMLTSCHCSVCKGRRLTARIPWTLDVILDGPQIVAALVAPELLAVAPLSVYCDDCGNVGPPGA